MGNNKFTCPHIAKSFIAVSPFREDITMANNIILLQRRSANDSRFHAIQPLLTVHPNSKARIYRAKPQTLGRRFVRYIQRTFDKAFMV